MGLNYAIFIRTKKNPIYDDKKNKEVDPLKEQIKDYQIISRFVLKLDWKCWNVIAMTATDLIDGL